MKKRRTISFVPVAKSGATKLIIGMGVVEFGPGNLNGEVVGTDLGDALVNGACHTITFFEDPNKTYFLRIEGTMIVPFEAKVVEGKVEGITEGSRIMLNG